MTTRNHTELTVESALTELRTYMCRIPPVDGEKYHLVGAVNEAGTTDEPSRAFWTNASVKALMQLGPQPEYVSLCGKVRGDWRGIQISDIPFAGEICRQCQRTQKTTHGATL